MNTTCFNERNVDAETSVPTLFIYDKRKKNPLAFLSDFIQTRTLFSEGCRNSGHMLRIFR